MKKYTKKEIKLLNSFSEYCHKEYYKNCWPDKDNNWIYDYREQIDTMLNNFIKK